MTGKKGYHLFDLDTHKSLISRDVQFFDTFFPYLPEPDHLSPIPLPSMAPNLPNSSASDCSLDHSIHPLATTSLDILSNTSTQSSISESVPLDSPPPQELKRGQRHINKTARLQYFVSHCDSNQSPMSTVPMFARYHQVTKIISFLILIPNPLFFIMHILPSFGMYLVFKNPLLMLRPVAEWVEAMTKEILALEQNHTWELIALPVGKRVIGSKWVYIVKLNPDGTIERYKARLVAKRHNQVYNIDYIESFSPVAKLVIVRMIIVVATIKGWPLF